MSTDELTNALSFQQRRKSPALQRILQLYWPAFARTHALPGFVHRAAYLLAHCRTAMLGGHVTRCELGHVLDVYYNSCRHRGCPACTATPRANWLAKWQAKMLDTPAHHVIFTVPNELVPLWRMNKRLFTKTLFWAASQSLLTLLADPQYLEPSLDCWAHCILGVRRWLPTRTAILLSLVVGWLPMERGRRLRRTAYYLAEC